MATIREKIEWKAYKIKRDYLMDKGFKCGMIHGYEKEVLDKLKTYYFRGVSLYSIMLSMDLCLGNCLIMAPLICFGFLEDDFKIVTADIADIMLDPDEIAENNKSENPNPHFGFHRFVERTLSDGTVLVYDTSDVLVYEKELYYKIEKPKVTSEITKEEFMQMEIFKIIFSSVPDDELKREEWMIPELERILEKRKNPYIGY